MTWREVSFVIWGLLAVALVACHVVALATHGRLPTADHLVSVVCAHPVTRALLVLGWMWLGWHTFAR